MIALDQDVVGTLLQDLDPDELALIRSTFSDDLDRSLAALAAAAAAHDQAAFGRVAHRLAGAAGAVGARALHDLAREAMLLAPGADLHATSQGLADAAEAARAALSPTGT